MGKKFIKIDLPKTKKEDNPNRRSMDIGMKELGLRVKDARNRQSLKEMI